MDEDGFADPSYHYYTPEYVKRYGVYGVTKMRFEKSFYDDVVKNGGCYTKYS